jgi:hypothetical protein
MRGRRLPEEIRHGANSLREPGCRPDAVIVQEDHHGLGTSHVVVVRDDVDAVAAQPLEARG